MINDLYNYIVEQLLNNDFAAGAAIASMIGGMMYYLKTIPVQVYNAVKRRIVYSVMLDESDNIYKYLNEWLYREYSSYFRNVKVKSQRQFDEDDNLVGCKISFEQYHDDFIFWYKNFPIKLSKQTEKMEGAYDKYNFEIGRFHLSTFFNKKIINSLLKEVESYYSTSVIKENKISIYRHVAASYSWDHFKDIKPVSLNNIIQPKSVKEPIIQTVNNWRKNKERLKDKGISLSLCLLFDGAPGSGKSSMVLALAYEYNMNVYTLNLNSIVSLNSLHQAVSNIPSNSIVQIDEIEDVYEGREAKNKDCKIPFSGFINILSGSMTNDNVLFILTSNDISKLDPALTRPGRVNLISTFVVPDVNMINEYVSKFFDTDCNLTNITNMPTSMSQLEELCIAYINDYEGLINKLK